MIKRLDEFKVGEEGIVKMVEGSGRVRTRLFDMGVTVDCKIKLVKLAPFKDPLEINIRGYELTLRKSEAHLVVMESEG